MPPVKFKRYIPSPESSITSNLLCTGVPLFGAGSSVLTALRHSNPWYTMLIAYALLWIRQEKNANTNPCNILMAAPPGKDRIRSRYVAANSIFSRNYFSLLSQSAATTKRRGT
jgi:hypothetical protein